MATDTNIDKELAQILAGYYGRDIRMAIHDALKKLWEAAQEAGGGDTPTPTPIPVPEYDVYPYPQEFRLVAPLVDDTYEAWESWVKKNYTYIAAQYTPLVSPTAPDDWETAYATKYAWIDSNGAYHMLPEAWPYEPETYYLFDLEHEPDPNNFYRYIINTKQEKCNVAGRDYITIGAPRAVYCFITYMGAGYTTPQLLTLDSGYIRAGDSAIYASSGATNTWIKFSFRIDGEWVTLTNPADSPPSDWSTCLDTDSQYYEKVGYQWKKMSTLGYSEVPDYTPYKYAKRTKSQWFYTGTEHAQYGDQRNNSSGFPKLYIDNAYGTYSRWDGAGATKETLRAALAQVGAIPILELETRGDAENPPDTWRDGFSHYWYWKDTDSTSPTYGDFIPFSYNTWPDTYAPSTYYYDPRYV